MAVGQKRPRTRKPRRPSKPRKAVVAKKARGPTLKMVLADINFTIPVVEAQVNASLLEAARARDEILRRSREVAKMRVYLRPEVAGRKQRAK